MIGHHITWKNNEGDGVWKYHGPGRIDMDQHYLYRTSQIRLTIIVEIGKRAMKRTKNEFMI